MLDSFECCLLTDIRKPTGIYLQEYTKTVRCKYAKFQKITLSAWNGAIASGRLCLDM